MCCFRDFGKRKSADIIIMPAHAFGIKIALKNYRGFFFFVIKAGCAAIGFIATEEAEIMSDFFFFFTSFLVLFSPIIVLLIICFQMNRLFI